ncbi:MAG: hypothetical protein FJ146_02375 [Deltaproteobacteria bacterium]|nr:hypothetical protein [Deltaproteobacteria bacterium]
MLTRSQLKTFLSALTTKRTEVLEAMNTAKQHALIDLSQDATGDLSHLRLHPADLGADAADQHTELMITNMEATALSQIDEAIGRLHEGRYGVCEACNQEIALERLKAIPETAFCLSCESAREEAGGSRPHKVLENHVNPATYESGEVDLTDQRARMIAHEQALRESGEPLLP